MAGGLVTVAFPGGLLWGTPILESRWRGLLTVQPLWCDARYHEKLYVNCLEEHHYGRHWSLRRMLCMLPRLGLVLANVVTLLVFWSCRACVRPWTGNRSGVVKAGRGMGGVRGLLWSRRPRSMERLDAVRSRGPPAHVHDACGLVAVLAPRSCRRVADAVIASLP